MATDILQLYQDYNVDCKTEGHKHCRPGWVNTPCPFCISEPGHEGYHLGATLDGSIFYCWRCGIHSPSKVISALLKIPERNAKSLLHQYLGGVHLAPEVKRKVRSKAHKWPNDTGPLQPQHIRYLEKRKFDPEKLVTLWNLQGTGPNSFLTSGEKDAIRINYSHRILAPIYWEGQEVTYQCRDITNKHPLRYLACPEDREIIKHKHILYGKQDKWKDTGICVEGITDVWRIGEVATCTFGIKYTPQQLRVLAQSFKRIFVWFDDEPQAIANAKMLCADLEFRGVDAEIITTKGDPGDTEQSEVDYIVKQLLKTWK